MVDFRKWFLTLAVLALAFGAASTAKAQLVALAFGAASATARVAFRLVLLTYTVIIQIHTGRHNCMVLTTNVGARNHKRAGVSYDGNQAFSFC